MYAEDSFFTLGPLGQIGLVALSGLLALLCLAMAIRFRRLPRLGSALCAFTLFAAFVWLSPQVYYGYYLFIFDDLPVQWVARLPSPWHLWGLLTFSTQPSLSAHSQGVLGWSLILSALLLPRRNAAN